MFYEICRWLSQAYPPKPTFDTDRDIPDLTGKVIIVTGGNTGIGKETVRVLLKNNAKVYMASRSRDRAEAAIADLKNDTGKEAIFLELDLANLGKVTKAAKEFMSKEDSLHVLINQAGVMMPPVDLITDDGYDLQFGSNVLGHAHFTLCLVPALQNGAKTSSEGKARVVFTSSLVVYHQQPPLIRFDTLKDGPERIKFGTLALYCQSKYGVVAFSNEFAKRYADSGVSSNAVNPGNIKSELQRYIDTITEWIVRKLFLYPTWYGALTQLYAGVSPETVNVNGGWFIPWARKCEHSKETKDPEMEAKLWDWVEEQRKGHEI